MTSPTPPEKKPKVKFLADRYDKFGRYFWRIEYGKQFWDSFNTFTTHREAIAAAKDEWARKNRLNDWGF